MDAKNFQNAIRESWRLRREKRLHEAELVLHEALAEYGSGGYEHNLLQANLADVLLRQGKVTESGALALEVLARDPAQVTALTVLGVAALERNEPAEAVENLTRAYARAPNPYRAGRLARALELSGRVEKALAVLEEALRQSPADEFLIRQYSRLQEKAAPAGAPGGALPARRDGAAAGEAAGGGEAEAHLPYAERIKAKLQHLEPAEAAAQLRKIIKVGKRKENPHLYLLLGDLERKAGREPEAAAAYREARALDPANRYALAQLLFCYRRMGQKEEAWPLFKLLLAQNPGDHTARASFMKDAVDLGRAEEAAAFFAELLHRYPHHKELYGLIRKLNKAASRGEGS